MKSQCNYCINKSECNECDKWLNKFIPSDEVKKYFNYSFCSGYHINTTNESLVSTHSIIIDNTYYCPYCGECMFSIQEKKTLIVIGHFCICQGARDELEYETKREELEKKHEKELYELECEYRDRLSFCSDKLLKIKQEKEKRRFDFFSHDYNHFSTLNGKSYTRVEEII